MRTVRIPRQSEPKPHIYLRTREDRSIGSHWDCVLTTAPADYPSKHWPSYLLLLQFLSRVNGCR